MRARPKERHSPTASGGGIGQGSLAAGRIIGPGASGPGLQRQTGQTLCMRWVDINGPASNHGLAIDDFSFTGSALAVRRCATWVLMPAGMAGLSWPARRR